VSAPSLPEAVSLSVVPELGRPRFAQVLGAEWCKLRSLRSTYLTLLVTLLLTAGLSALLCWTYVARYSQLSFSDRIRVADPAFISVSGVLLAQVAVGVLGVLTMSSEYSTGMIRVTFSAVPRRLEVLAAKVVIFLVVSLGVGVLSGFASFFAGQAILSRIGLGLSITQPGCLRVAFGVALYLGVLGLIGLALGAIIRRTAGAVAALFALLLILPAIASALPSPWDVDILRYLPDQAGIALLHLIVAPGRLAPWNGFVVFVAYGAAALLLAAVLVSRRDA
jgi:ABC-2 type transport system permease protein